MRSGRRRRSSNLASTTPTVRGEMKTVCGVTPKFVNDIDLPEVSAASGGVGASTDSRLHVSSCVLRATYAREDSACL